MTTIATANQILDFVIKSSVLLGLCFVVVVYATVSYLDRDIEKHEREFEDASKARRGQAGVVESIINGQIAELEKSKNEKVAPLERKRQRLLSKIPFLK